MIHHRPPAILLFSIILSLSACSTPPATQNATTQITRIPWSSTVNGLHARIESVSSGRWEDGAIFILFENVGDHPITIPTLRIFNQPQNSPWTVQVQRAGNWESVPWDKVKICDTHPGEIMNIPELRETPTPATLKPRETALVQIVLGYPFEYTHNAKATRVLLSQDAQGPIQGWSGALEIPRPIPFNRVDENLYLPNYIPPFSHVRKEGMNEPFEVSQLEHLQISNWQYNMQLRNYRPEQVVRELDKRLASESDTHVKILIALEAARRGSAAGKNFLLECRKSADYEIAFSTCVALGYASTIEPTPQWVMQAMIDAVADDRVVTNPPRELGDASSVTIGTLAEHDASLLSEFSRLKYPPAVPLFLKWAKEHDGNRALAAIYALGNSEDPRAISLLFDLLKQDDKNPDLSYDSYHYHAILGALIRLKAPGIEEILIARIYDNDIVEMIEYLGDPRVIPALKQIVATGKAQPFKDSSPENDRYCVDAARIAIAALEPGDPIPRYSALLEDPSIPGVHFNAAVRIRDSKLTNPRAIPALLNAIHTDPDGMTTDVAIQALAKYKYKSAVTGLIDSFSTDFSKKSTFKFERDIFPDQIANSLSKITGQSFGPDPAPWKKWWTTEGQKSSTLPD